MRINPTLLAFPILLALTAAGYGQALEERFADPPPSTRPWCYWYWMSDNISREGLTKDLEAMARVGIGEVLIGNILLKGLPVGSVKALTEPWWGMVEQAIREGDRVGVNVGMFNCPGWSQSGGPWVKPEQAMRYMVWSETRIQGPTSFNHTLPVPKQPFQDIAVLAFPAPASDADHLVARKPGFTFKPATERGERMVDGNLETSTMFPGEAGRGANPFSIQIDLAEPMTARSLTLYPATESAFAARCLLEAADDAGVLRTVRSFEFHRDNPVVNVGPMPLGPVYVSFAPARSRSFKVSFTNVSGPAGLAEIELSGAARVEYAVEKQLGKMHTVPLAMWDAYLWPKPAEPESADLAVSPQSVLNLSDRMAADGTLRWEAPAGDWVVLRVGMTPTGTKNEPSSPEGQGFEVDKMNREPLAKHFDAFIGALLKRMPAGERKAFRHVVADSYEMGSENWTDGFGDQFRKVYGYDPKPWLAVLTGRVLGNADQSDRFLWDLRRLVADRVASEYVGGLRDLCRANGLEMWLENYGHWGFPAEFLQYGGQSECIGGEFWATGILGSIELRAASSCANIYNKPVVSAEAFTGGDLFEGSPRWLKARGDWALCQGINHFVLHLYIHQPWADRLPGINAPFGTEFNRLNTWFEPGRAWIDYLRRCFVMLQHGTRRADVCYFIGEDTPKMTGVCNPALPTGYDFDYINGEVIREKLSVENGRLKLPHGVSYHLLVLPELETMRPAVLRKLRALVADGATVFGPPPSRSPSLQDYPACDEEVRKLAVELWGDDVKANKQGEHHLGKGRVVWGRPLTEVLASLQTPPDFEARSEQPDRKFLFTHRTSAETDVYFVTNQRDRTERAECVFRIADRQPELWDAVNGRCVDAADWRIEDGRTVVPMTFAPNQSWFVVFRRTASPPTTTRPNQPEMHDLRELTGAWQVQFDPKFGGPQEATFDVLVDWTKRPEPGIKYYAGRAVYRKTFNVPASMQGRRLLLDLGEVRDLATVRVNGKSVGTVWTAPWRVDISLAAAAGENSLEVEVYTPWFNKLVGDEALPENQRRTWVMLHVISKDAPLKPSGLLGPVRLLDVIP